MNIRVPIQIGLEKTIYHRTMDFSKITFIIENIYNLIMIN